MNTVEFVRGEKEEKKKIGDSVDLISDKWIV